MLPSPSHAFHRFRPLLWLAGLLLGTLLAGCALERPAPVLKVGLIAPFEGERRQLGYHLLPAITAATPHQVRGQQVEWVILDSGGDPLVARQRVQELLNDPAVFAIIGPLLPEEVEEVGWQLSGGEIAWWPLAPSGSLGMQQWQQGLDAPAWGPSVWPAVRRGEVQRYLDPQLPADPGDFAPVGGERPWPQDWLVWQAATLAFEAIEQAETLDRAAIQQVARPLLIPKAVEYQTQMGDFPGVPVAVEE